MNQVQLVGRIASAIRLQDFGTGEAVKTKATFVVAVDRRRRPAPPDWVRVETWGLQATSLVRHNGKGARLAITGHLRGTYLNSDGGERGGQLRLAVVADTITYLSPPRPAASDPIPAAEPASPSRGRR